MLLFMPLRYLNLRRPSVHIHLGTLNGKHGWSFVIPKTQIPLPVTERHLIAFLGWIRSQRKLGKRNISSTSVPQYLSAVRQMHTLITGESLPSFPFADLTLRAYRNWEEQYFPVEKVRCGLGAEKVQQIWALETTMNLPSTVRDCVVCVFAFCFNGLRESSVMSSETSKDWFQQDTLYAGAKVWKGRAVSREQRLAYHRLSDFFISS